MDLYTLFVRNYSYITLPLYPLTTTVEDAIKVLAIKHTLTLEKDTYNVVFTYTDDGVTVERINEDIQLVELNVALQSIHILITRENYTPLYTESYFGPAKYRLIDVLGHGTTSWVYRGIAPNGTVVALKIYNTVGGKIQQKYIDGEVLVLKAIKNDNKCNLALCYEDYFVVQEIPVLVTTYVRGRDLEHIYKSLTYIQKLRVIKQLLEVAIYLKDRKIAHRDIKLANILYVDDGTIRLLDFGYSCFIGECGSIVGTPKYMDPNVAKYIKSMETYNHDYIQLVWTKADMWSIGIVIYMLDSTKDYDPNKSLPTQLTNIQNKAIRAIATYILVQDITKRPSPEDVLTKFS